MNATTQSARDAGRAVSRLIYALACLDLAQVQRGPDVGEGEALKRRAVEARDALIPVWHDLQPVPEARHVLGHAIQKILDGDLHGRELNRQGVQTARRAARQVLDELRRIAPPEHFTAGGPVPQGFVPQPEDVAILRVLAETGTTMSREAIEGALPMEAPLEVKAIGRRLKVLEEGALVHRPHGQRGGRAITEKGRELLRGIDAPQVSRK